VQEKELGQGIFNSFTRKYVLLRFRKDWQFFYFRLWDVSGFEFDDLNYWVFVHRCLP